MERMKQKEEQRKQRYVTSRHNYDVDVAGGRMCITITLILH